jgi:hypothetical protein
LAPLAFVSPQLVSAIIDGTAPAELTVTGLPNALPYLWIQQLDLQLEPKPSVYKL